MTPQQAVRHLVHFKAADKGRLPPFDPSGIFDAGLDRCPPSRPATTDQAKASGEALDVKVKPAGNRRMQPVVDKFFHWLRASRLETDRMAYWWANRMLTSSTPLQERMALFCLHQRLLTYVSDSVAGFMADMERSGRADDVTMMIFSEFGRRVPENTSLGTDHGTANVMFMAGKPVKGGHYGAPPSLTALDAGDNLAHTTDFRRVYATAMQGWLGLRDTRGVLRGEFEPFPMFA